MFLRGRCRDCHAGISMQYPLVELVLGGWFAFVAFQEIQHYTLEDPALLQDGMMAATFGFLLLGLAVMDWQTHLLPDSFTLTGAVLGFLFVCTRAYVLMPGEEVHLLGPHQFSWDAHTTFHPQHGALFFVAQRVLAAAICYLILYSIRALYKLLRKRDGMGLGDAKLMALIALFLGLGPALLTFFIATLLATLYGVVLLLHRRADATTHLPLGTFLCIAAFFSMLWAQVILNWYTSFLR